MKSRRKISVQIDSVAKEYDGNRVLSDVSMNIQAGETLALLGHNGSGKTVLMECIEGIRTPSEGTVQYFEDEEPVSHNSIKDCIGVQRQHPSFFKKLKPREILELHASFYSQSEDIDSLIEEFGMGDFSNRLMGELSGGQSQKVALAVAVVNRPAILFLDEPTVGLDVMSRQRFFEILEKLKKRGTSIVITTHYIEEVQDACDRVAILVGGKLYRVGRPSEIVAEHMAAKTVYLSCSEQEQASLFKLVSEQFSNVWCTHDKVCVSTADELETMRFILGLESVDQMIQEVSVKASTIEDVLCKTNGWVGNQ